MKNRTEKMMKKCMTAAGALVALLVLVMGSGCISTQKSEQGGIVPLDEGFSLTVPTSCTLKQGASAPIDIVLNRGAYFKRDVDLCIHVDGISVSPSYVLIKASDKPELKFQITAPREAAIGEYRVTVKGIPETGDKASTVFIVKVIPQ